MSKKKGEPKKKKKAARPIIPFPLQGIPEVMETKLAQQIYRDGLQKPVKAASAVATEVLEGLRLFTAPFALAARYTNRLLTDLEKCRKKVPPERQVASPPEIAGPIIQSLRFTSDENPLREMFLNLLTASIDSARQAKVHPAFATILPQLSPDEAKLLAAVNVGHSRNRPQEHILGYLQNPQLNEPGKDRPPVQKMTARLNPKVDLAFSENVEMYLSRLVAFTLITVGKDVFPWFRKFEDGGNLFAAAASPITLTPFGVLFAETIQLPDRIIWPVTQRHKAIKTGCQLLPRR